MLEPSVASLRVRALSLDASRVTEAPTGYERIRSLHLHPLLEVYARNMTRLQLEAQVHARLEDLDDGLLAYLLHEVELVT